MNRLETAEFWWHITDAVILVAVHHAEDEARNRLAAANRITPLPDAAYKAILEADCDAELDHLLDTYAAVMVQQERERLAP